MATVTVLLADGGTLTVAQRSQALRTLVAQLEIQGRNNANPSTPYASPDSHSVGAFKRIALNNLGTSSRPSEIFIGRNSMVRMLRGITPIAGEGVYSQIFYALLVRPDCGSSAIAPGRTFHTGKTSDSGTVTPNEIRLRTPFTRAYWDAGVAAGDFLCVVPVAEMDFHTLLAQRLEEAGITPNLDDVPDVIGFVVTAEHHPEIHQRFADALSPGQVSGYLRIPEPSDA
jgi:hypothetical protein